MPSIKYVIELSEQDKATLLDIVKKAFRFARTIFQVNILLASYQRNETHMTVSKIAKVYYATPITVQNARASYASFRGNKALK